MLCLFKKKVLRVLSLSLTRHFGVVVLAYWFRTWFRAILRAYVYTDQVTGDQIEPWRFGLGLTSGSNLQTRKCPLEFTRLLVSCSFWEYMLQLVYYTVGITFHGFRVNLNVNKYFNFKFLVGYFMTKSTNS